MQPIGCMDVEPEPSHGVPCQGLFRKTDVSGSTMPIAAHLEGVSFSVTGVVCHALHLRLLLLLARDMEVNPGPTCSGFSKSIRCDTTPIVSSTFQWHFHRTCSRLTRSQNGIHGFVCFFCSGGAAALPSTATVTSTSVLPRHCLLCHTNIRHGIRPIMCKQCSHLALRKCSGVFRCVANPSWLFPACSLPTTCITIHQLRVLQCNCDFLATKFLELADVFERYRIDVALLQETKLDQEVPTQQIPGFYSVRRDRDTSCTRHHRAVA